MVSISHSCIVYKLYSFVNRTRRSFWNQKRTTGNINHNQCTFADTSDSKPFCFTTELGEQWEHCNCKACNDGPRPTSHPSTRPTSSWQLPTNYPSNYPTNYPTNPPFQTSTTQTTTTEGSPTFGTVLKLKSGRLLQVYPKGSEPGIPRESFRY